MKEAAGKLTGDESLEREGQAQQDKAEAQREVATKEAEAEKARAEAAVHEARKTPRSRTDTAAARPYPRESGNHK